jgi:selenocysteine-specific elongation factor
MLQVMSNLSSKQLSRLLQDLGAKQKIFLFDRETVSYVSGTYVQQATEELLAFVQDYHRQNPMKSGVTRGMVASNWGRRLPQKLVHFLIERCLKDGRLVAEQEVLRLPEHSITLASDQTKLKEDLLAAYRQGGTQPPNLNDVLERFGVPKKEAQPVLQLLADEGKLVKLKDGLFYSAEALETIRNLVREHFRNNSQLSPTDFKELTGLSRKFSIPLLEQLDKEKLTMRVGDVRKLRKGQ